MSLQFSFFAMHEDRRVIAQELLNTFTQGLLWIPPRGKSTDMRFQRIIDIEDLLPNVDGEFRVLVPSDHQPNVVFTENTGRLSIAISENPVFEFSPGFEGPEKTVKIGRFFYSYNDAPSLRKQIQELFRALRRLAEPYLSKRGLWIFPQARAQASLLQQWVGSPWKNRMRD